MMVHSADRVEAAKVTTTFEKISPDMAAKYLAMNGKNRALKRRLVEKLTKKMEDGRFVVTHQGIAFGTDVRLLDGQHRLMAIVKSETTQTLLVTRGVDPKVFDDIDDGVDRNAVDILTILDWKETAMSAGILRLVHDHENGLLHSRRSHYPSNDEIRELAGRHRDVEQFAAAVRPYKHAKLSQVAFVAYMASRVHLKEANAWLHKVCTGRNCDGTEGAYLLRERLIHERQLRAKRGHGMTDGPAGRHVILALCIKAWNADHDGIEIKRLNFKATRDKWPELSL